MKEQKCYITDDGTIFIDKKDATVYEQQADALVHFENNEPPNDLTAEGTLTWLDTNEPEIMSYFDVEYKIK